MRRAAIILVMAFLAGLTVAAGSAAEAEVSAGARTELGGAGTQAVRYRHNDCVGPGAPLTAGPHSDHTARASGFVAGIAVVFRLTPLQPFGPGICPTTVSGPVLSQDFTGRWRMRAVCRFTQNDGAVFLDWVVEAVAGVVTAQGSTGTPCLVSPTQTFSLDITISIGPTALFGIPLGPLGGILLEVEQ